MDENYRMTDEYIELPDNERGRVVQLIYAQTAQGDMEELKPTTIIKPKSSSKPTGARFDRKS